MLYANSSDGIHWTKPNLGLVDIDKLPGLLGKRPELKGIGTTNNLVFAGGGVGVVSTRDRSRRLGCAPHTDRISAVCSSRTRRQPAASRPSGICSSTCPST